MVGLSIIKMTRTNNSFFYKRRSNNSISAYEDEMTTFLVFPQTAAEEKILIRRERTYA